MATLATRTDGTFPFVIPPTTNISGFTYKEGISQLEILYGLRDYINKTLRPEFNDEMARIIDDFNTGIAGAENSVTNAKDKWLTTFETFIADVTAQLAALNDTAATSLIENELSLFGAAAREVIESHSNEIFLRQDGLSAAGGALFLTADELVVNVMRHGAVGDGVTDDTAALQAASDYAYNLSPDAILHMPARTFKITSTVQFRTGLDASRATLNYDGAGTAVILGSTVAGSAGVTSRKTFNCPRVVHTAGTKWDSTSIGIRANNLNSCMLAVPFIQDFEVGLDCMGNGQGFVHNTVNILSLWSNHKNLKLSQDDTGWCNSNTFLGGRLSAGGVTADDMEHCHIYAVRPASSAVGNANGNTFVGMSLEAGVNMYYRVVMAGANNSFINCRWEALGGSVPRVLWKSTAAWNRIVGGYDAQKVVETYDGGTFSGGPSTIQDGGNTRARAYNTSGQVIPPNAATVLKGWSSLSLVKATYDAATGEFTPRWGRWRISGKVAFNPAASGYVQAVLMCGTTTVDYVRLPSSSSQLTTVKFDGSYNFNGTDKFYVLVQHSGTVDNVLPTSTNLTSIEATYESA